MTPFNAGDWVKIRVVWEEREGLRHAVEAAGVIVPDGPNGGLQTDQPVATDCGVPLPDMAYMTEAAVTCELCLWQFLDPIVQILDREAQPV